jgi:VanZ family protein
MRLFRLLICVGYWGLLTVLLLTPYPAAVLGLRKLPTFPWGDIGTHFVAFTILTLVVLGSRWPKRLAWRLVLALLAYGLAAESLQAFVPPRAVEFLDYVENLLGVGVGTVIYWMLRLSLQPSLGEAPSDPRRPSPAAVAHAITDLIPPMPAPGVVCRRSYVGDKTSSPHVSSILE